MIQTDRGEPMLWRVETKRNASSPWKFFGVIESNFDAADANWREIVKDLRLHAFRLVPDPR
jgi:hypothetical protein